MLSGDHAHSQQNHGYDSPIVFNFLLWEDMLSMFVIVFVLYLYLYLYSMCLCICLPNGVRGSFSAVILVSVAVRGW